MSLLASALAAGISNNFIEGLNKSEKQSLEYFIKIAPNLLRKAGIKIEYWNGEGIDKYILYMYHKCSTIKTLLNRNSPSSVNDCFVSPNIRYNDSNGSTKFTNIDGLLEDSISSNPLNIITGLAGSGKTVLLKKLFIECISKNIAKFPIFFEFREISNNDFKEKILENSIIKSISVFFPGFNNDLFSYSVKNNHFYFILDGFDEISPSIREKITLELFEISQKNSLCPIIITSRPSEDFIAWQKFRQLEMEKFNINQTIEFISKSPFDIEKKQEFIKNIRKISYTNNKESFYGQNVEFLSNPLLTSMMLLVFDKTNSIPKNKSIYYSKCFDVLLEEHDSSKGRFKRELYSQLSLEIISNIFLYFCVLSYKDNKFSFISEECKIYIVKAITKLRENNIDEIKEQKRNILRDFCESLSIMQVDGTYIEFIHRSFQEYFFAKFTVYSSSIPMFRTLSSVLNRGDSANLLSLVDSIDHNKYEIDFIIPIINFVMSEIDEKRDNKKDFVQIFYNKISKSFGYSPYKDFNDWSINEEYNDIFFDKDMRTKSKSPFYIAVIIEHINLYYKNIMASKEDAIQMYMSRFTSFNFNINIGEVKNISFISYSDIENSGLYECCLELSSVIDTARTEINKLTSIFNDGWDEEF